MEDRPAGPAGVGAGLWRVPHPQALPVGLLGRPGPSPLAPLLLLGFRGLLNSDLGHTLQVLQQLIQLLLDDGQHLHSAQVGVPRGTDAVPIHVQHLVVQAL